MSFPIMLVRPTRSSSMVPTLVLGSRNRYYTLLLRQKRLFLKQSVSDGQKNKKSCWGVNGSGFVSNYDTPTCNLRYGYHQLSGCRLSVAKGAADISKDVYGGVESDLTSTAITQLLVDKIAIDGATVYDVSSKNNSKYVAASHNYESLQNIYGKMVHEGEISEDERQRKVLSVLDSLCERIDGYKPPEWPEEEIVEIIFDPSNMIIDHKGKDLMDLTKGMRILSIERFEKRKPKSSDFLMDDYSNKILTSLKKAYGAIRRDTMITKQQDEMINNNTTDDDEGNTMIELLKVKAVKLKEVNCITPPLGVYVHGEVGVGKSMLMDMFYKHVPVEKKKRIHFHSFMQQVMCLINKQQKENIGNISALVTVAELIMKDSWLICFDEVQITDVATATIMSQLFEIMFRHGMVLCCTSNRSPDNLFVGGIQREHTNAISASLQKFCVVHNVESGVDYRQIMSMSDKSNSIQVYYRSDDANESTKFDDLFRTVIKDHPITSRKINHLNRDVLCPVVVNENKVARFTFEELCYAALGANDYIEICKNYSTIFLSDIPILAAFQQRNELRRFITFLDAAYEMKVKVVFHALSDPEGICLEDIPYDHTQDIDKVDAMHVEMIGELMDDFDRAKAKSNSSGSNSKEEQYTLAKFNLFSGEEEKFAVKRAISRIKEMTSKKYLLMAHQPDAMTHFSKNGLGSHGSHNNNSGESAYDKNHRHAIHHYSHNPSNPRPVASDDFGDEASYTDFSLNHTKVIANREWWKAERKLTKEEKASMSKHQKGKLGMPKFSTRHFFGIGWWTKETDQLETVQKRKEARKNKTT